MKPDAVSKKASNTLGMVPEIIKGREPSRDRTNQALATMKKPSLRPRALVSGALVSLKAA